MSHQEYIDSCNEVQLKRLIELAQDRVKIFNGRKKTNYLSVGDDWLNIGLFHMEDYQRALECFGEIYKNRLESGGFDKLSIEVAQYFPEEVEDILQ